jgi:ABC-type sugar transport system permease subunit
VATYFISGGTLSFFQFLARGEILLPYSAYQPILLIVVIGLLGTILSRSMTGQTALQWIGGISIALASILVLTTMIWTFPTKAFESGTPAWLGNTNLIIPAIVFWGFPWIGTIGVLIYLSGLQNISADVYEAAELDGVGSVGKLFKIELPLILAQVRINLIFMTIGTLTGYGMFLLLLGPDGGPGNKGMVPGLYMFREAFFNQRYGYACALGMVMFVIVLAITIFYQRYVKVEK